MTVGGFNARDWLQVGVIVVGGIVSYVGLSGKVDNLTEKVAEVKASVTVIDSRLWELQGRGPRPTTLRSVPCPADVTRVAYPL